MIYLNQIRFNKLLNSIEGINAKTLSIRLKEMEKDGLIRRKIYNESPIRIEYEMRERNGIRTNIGADVRFFYEILS